MTVITDNQAQIVNEPVKPSVLISVDNFLDRTVVFSFLSNFFDLAAKVALMFVSTIKNDTTFMTPDSWMYHVYHKPAGECVFRLIPLVGSFAVNYYSISEDDLILKITSGEIKTIEGIPYTLRHDPVIMELFRVSTDARLNQGCS